MCGIGVAISLNRRPIPHLRSTLEGFDALLAHRGPDGSGSWLHPERFVGLAHRRLSVIGLDDGHQPMTDGEGSWIAYNGEIYNFRALRHAFGTGSFATHTDTEVVLRLFQREGPASLHRLRGMFAFAVWDEVRDELHLARDRFGIKPLYYTIVDGVLYAASEAKALVPLLPRIATSVEGLRDYLTFQFQMPGRTLFDGVHELPPAHVLRVANGTYDVHRWWEVRYEQDEDHSEQYFVRRLREIATGSIEEHLVADVPVGAYVSGGLDSGVIAAVAARSTPGFVGFAGRFDCGAAFDESGYAREIARSSPFELRETTITPEDFRDSIEQIAYHLDYPVAGPGAFPQFIVSAAAARELKVVLGGQGGDEIFGGYARYLLAYFEQCIKAAIEGTAHRAQFVVTYESIIPNLESLRAYKPLIQSFWKDGVFADLDERYFRLVNRSGSLGELVRWELFDGHEPFADFMEVFGARNVGRDSYFDRMTHFDFKTLLPALLQVEDRMSMAHGLESRTPFVDHEVVEFAATLPALVKFRNGELKRALKLALGDVLPESVLARKDKMGFPVPLADWAKGPLRELVLDAFGGSRREYLAPGFSAEALISSESGHDRSLWGLLSLELWQRAYHDRAAHWRELGRRMKAPDQAERSAAQPAAAASSVSYPATIRSSVNRSS